MKTDENQLLISKIPFWAYVLTFGAFLSWMGLYSDISWHFSIGRDGLLTTPHMLMGATPVLGILLFIYWVTQKTPYFGINFLGLKAPAGAWLSLAGGSLFFLCMLWDNWWHSMWGIDPVLESPPHQLLAFSFVLSTFGNLMVLTSLSNNVTSSLVPKTMLIIFIYLAIITGGDALVRYERGFANYAHDPIFASIFCSVFIYGLVSAPCVYSQYKWNTTFMAIIFTGLWLTIQWLIQPIEAQPLLGPVYNPITHMLPLTLQTFIIPSAFAIDLVKNYLKDSNVLLKLFSTFTVGFVIFIIVQWFYGSFLLSEYSHNWFFGGGQYNFYTNPTHAYVSEFWYATGDSPPTIAYYLTEWAKYYALGLFSTLLYYKAGSWMSQLKR